MGLDNLIKPERYGDLGNVGSRSRAGRDFLDSIAHRCFRHRIDVQGPLIPELKEILPEAFEARIKRPGIVNAMHHDGFNQAVKAIGRKKLFVAGVTTEICVTFPVFQMLDEGYEVQVSADASASYTKYGDDIALRRMEKAGAIITTVDQIISELAVDWTSPLGQKLVGILNYH